MDPTRTGTTRSSSTTRPGVGVSGSDRPRLAAHVRLTFCRTRQRKVLLHPEAVVVLNGSGAAILELCDGRHTVAEIVDELGARYETVPDDDVRQFLARLVARRWVELTDG
ncbi:pyrroloquinoline quinone biosynthesis protein PqqD [Streptomyces olivaceoviridis]|uniref:pyrroloquinoline quinone biosynthesis peptide chaperone PqqD n=1 Tax=Streptomyces olivaceoviridis TaxID=1921 RepID=UPI00167BDCB4|nr:pyrroloquinoline quinone biosynthesis peptide chaperone PqqD [Streptomyces olivaceoviridis]GGZ28581.1 pyrroloquinoline quinone biosynthesis protein PqqD [Streptomyces olivaceoviridis]